MDGVNDGSLRPARLLSAWIMRIFFQTLLESSSGVFLKKPQGFSGTSLEQCLCLINPVSAVQLNIALTFPEHLKPNR